MLLQVCGQAMRMGQVCHTTIIHPQLCYVWSLLEMNKGQVWMISVLVVLCCRVCLLITDRAMPKVYKECIPHNSECRITAGLCGHKWADEGPPLSAPCCVSLSVKYRITSFPQPGFIVFGHCLFSDTSCPEKRCTSTHHPQTANSHKLKGTVNRLTD